MLAPCKPGVVTASGPFSDFESNHREYRIAIFRPDPQQPLFHVTDPLLRDPV